MTISHQSSGLVGRTPLLRPTLLCVDDDPEMTRAIELILSNYAIDVVSNCCGYLGFSHVFQIHPDVIITDLRMPNGDGQQFLEALKSHQQTAHIPVIVLSGQRDSELHSRMRRLGAASFLLKPLHYTSLLAEIRRFIPLHEVQWNQLDTDAY